MKFTERLTILAYGLAAFAGLGCLFVVVAFLSLFTRWNDPPVVNTEVVIPKQWKCRACGHEWYKHELLSLHNSSPTCGDMFCGGTVDKI